MQKYRVLIIDDEENSRSNTRNMLQNYCPEVEVVGEAGSGPEGKVKIQELKPHLVFLDINMPGMSGFEMLEGIYNRDFCVVFLTAYSEHGINAVKAGATDYLMKPLILSELQGAIRKVIQHYDERIDMILIKAFVVDLFRLKKCQADFLHPELYILNQ